MSMGVGLPVMSFPSPALRMIGCTTFFAEDELFDLFLPVIPTQGAKERDIEPSCEIDEPEQLAK